MLKPLFGSQGQGLALLEQPSQLPAESEVAGVYYLQRYVRRADGAWLDYRVFVSGGEPVAGMIRDGESWITNVHRGGRARPWPIPPTAAELAVAAAEVVGADYAGVDLVEDGEGGFLVLEVNSMPAWSGLQGVTEVDIAGVIARDFLRAVRAGREPRRVVQAQA